MIARVILLALVSALGSCGIFQEKPNPGLVEPNATVPEDFLFSWHKPFNEWMDSPVRVYYNKVPLEQIFENSPFIRLSYKFSEKPEEMPLVSMDTLGLTRRQLLWSIAHDNNLQMILKTLPDGHPNEVIIRDRGDQNKGGEKGKLKD
ncbi:MAG: hypothetical protein GY899_05800 [Verrucomicrobiaceae bacterium]|nr:hypothetical protein [Verrucomicrobiaceae bacterium]